MNKRKKARLEGRRGLSWPWAMRAPDSAARERSASLELS